MARVYLLCGCACTGAHADPASFSLSPRVNTGLYVMYTHMMRQRRRALGKGLWGDKRTQVKVAEKQRKGQ